MSLKVLYAGNMARADEYQNALTDAFEKLSIDADLSSDHTPDIVDYIIYAPNGPLSDFTPYTRAKAVLGLWAGVEKVVDNATLTQPYTRMVDPGLTKGMREWVTGHVLRHHLGMDQDICRTDTHWGRPPPPLAGERCVGVLGLGALGSVAAKSLSVLGFQVAGWSRSPKQIDGVICLSGDQGLAELLAQSEILILLLPLTASTENLMNAGRLALLPKGAVILNPGRGALIDDDALLSALDSGHVGHATLDVFRIEPLPADHPYWSHPNVTVTPHIAADTRPRSAAMVVAENIRRVEAGEPLLHVVDRIAGY